MRLFKQTVAVLFACALGSAQASFFKDTKPAPNSQSQVECLGYYTLTLPGEVEYALARLNVSGWGFEGGPGVWGWDTHVNFDGLGELPVDVGPVSGWDDLNRIMRTDNAPLQREMDDVKERLAEVDSSTPALKRILTENLADLHLYEPIPQRDAIARIADIGNMKKYKLLLHALVNGHYLFAEIGDPKQPAQALFDELTSHLQPREPGQMPSGAGACIPFGLVTGESAPARIGLALRAKSQPDIVVYLMADDAATSKPDDAKTYLRNATLPGRTFIGSLGTAPMNRLRPFEDIELDSHKGLATFIIVKRDSAGFFDPYKVNNSANNDIDWSFLAYAPGLAGGKPGESFNVTLRIERFGRFAKQEMTESEFRDLALRIAASVKRRPGAWVVH